MPQTLTYSITDPSDSNEEWSVVTNGSVDLTVSNGQTVVLASAPTGLVTITLPDAAGDNANRVIIVKKMDATANGVYIATTGGDTIDGASGYTISTQYASVTLVSDGSNWNIV